MKFTILGLLFTVLMTTAAVAVEVDAIQTNYRKCEQDRQQVCPKI